MKEENMRRLILTILALSLCAPLALFAGGTDESPAVTTTAGGSARVGQLDAGQYDLDDYEKQTGKSLTLSESPFLDGKGLPSVADRLPDNPLVMETWEANGTHGGTLTWTYWGAQHDVYQRHINATKLLEIAPSSSTHRYNYLGATIQPNILEEFESLDGARRFRFTIRRGLRWSDGVPVTTEDVEFTFEDVWFNEEISPTIPSWARWGGEPVKVNIVDDYTFELTFAKPYGLLLGQVTQWPPGRFIQPKHHMMQYHKEYTDISEILPIMKEYGHEKADEWGKFYDSINMGKDSADNFNPARYPNAIGYPVLTPWMPVDEPTPGELIMERNPYYHKVDPTGKQLPYIDRLHKVLVSNIEVYTAKILAGETDIQFQYTRLADYPILKENEDKGNYSAILLPAWQEQQLVYCLLLDPIDPVDAEIVQDKRFRQAVSMAVDREEVKNTVFLGFGRPAQVAPPKGSAVWEQRMEDAYVQHDVDAANALLDEMGLEWDANREYRLKKDGNRLTISFTYYNVVPASTPGAELFPDYMKSIGVETQINLIEGSHFWQVKAAREKPIFYDWWNPTQNFIVGPLKFNVVSSWNAWYNNPDTAESVPPPEAQRMYEVRDALYEAADFDEQMRHLKVLWESQAENVWVIGTVADVPTPLIYNKNLGNIGISEERSYYSVVVGDAAEQWFWKE